MKVQRMYSIFPYEKIRPLIDWCYDVAHDTVRGKRNRQEAVPEILRKALYEGLEYEGTKHTAFIDDYLDNTGMLYDKLHPGDIIYRRNGVKFSGGRGYAEYRQFLDAVTVERVCEKLTCIGTCGERVREDQIICVCRKDMTDHDDK